MNRSTPPSGGAAAARTDATASVARPARMTGTLPKRSRQATGDRRQPEHAERMTADDEADRRKAVAMLGHVQRRHRHDQDHDDLAGDERDDRHRDTRSGEYARERHRVPASRRLRGRGVTTDARAHTDQGAAATNAEDGRRAHEDDRDEVGAGELRQAERDRDLTGRCDKVRPDDRTDRGTPHDDADGRCPPIRGDQIRRRVTGQLVRCIAEADQHGADEQDRKRRRDDGRRRDERPQRHRRRTRSRGRSVGHGGP